MTERFLIAITLVSGLMLIGVLVRGLVARRHVRLIETLTLETVPAGSPRIIAFSGPGCAACTTQRRILESLSAEWQTAVDVEYVDAVVEATRARRFGVLAVPTTVVAAADGRIIGINSGLATDERLRAQLREAA